MSYHLMKPAQSVYKMHRLQRCLVPLPSRVIGYEGANHNLCPSITATSQRCISARPPPPPEKKGFFHSIFENIRQEMSRDKEFKESLKQFRQEAQKLEESDALKKAREKFESIAKSEVGGGTQQIKEFSETIKGKVGETFEGVKKSEIGKKSMEVTEEITKQAKAAAEAIAKSGEKLADAQAVKTIGQGVQVVKDEVNIGAGMYKRPEVLRKRKERAEMADDREILPNEDATGVELHKDSKWSQSWNSFRENNPYVNKVFDWKMKYDESDNPVVRVTRVFTEKVSDMFGGLFSKTELSEVMTEIVKMDPTFDKVQFAKELEDEIIPNILEAMCRGDLEIIQDWCHEPVYNMMATSIKAVLQAGNTFDSRILDLNNVEIVMGKMMEQGPVLIITFQTQQIDVIRDAKGNVVEGDPDKIVLCNYVWVMCRDQTELDPKAAWRVLEMASSSSPQFL